MAKDSLSKEQLKDIVNKRFERILVVNYDGHYRTESNNTKRHYYNCLCDCGENKTIMRDTLLKGYVKSCGCLKSDIQKGRKKHGLTKSRIYNIYQHMIQRCHNRNNSAYVDYGARGIIVCEEWLGESGFGNFFNWSESNGYNKSLSIERIDNNLGYSPLNCKWETNVGQANNRRTNKEFLATRRDGKTFRSKSIKSTSLELGVSVYYINKSLKGNNEYFNEWKFEYII